jgi:hypothetical protein
VPDITGQYNVTFIANDTANQFNNTETTYFIVTEDNPPDVFNLIPTAGTAYAPFTTIEIGADVTDDYGVSAVFANVTYPNNTVNLLTLTYAGGNKYNTSFAIPNLEGTYNVQFIANDTANQFNNTETTYFIVTTVVAPTICCGISLSATPDIARKRENVLIAASVINLFTGEPANQSDVKSINVSVYLAENGSESLIVSNVSMIYLEPGLWYHELNVGDNASGNYIATATMLTNQAVSFERKASATFRVDERATGVGIIGVSPDFVNIDQEVMLAAEITYNGMPIDNSSLTNATLILRKINGTTQVYTLADSLQSDEGMIYLIGSFNETGVYYLNWTVDYLNEQRMATEILVVVAWDELLESANTTENQELVDDITEAKAALTESLWNMESLQEFNEEEVFLITDSVNTMDNILDQLKKGKISSEEARKQFNAVKNRLGDTLTGAVVGSSRKSLTASLLVKLKDWRFLLFVVLMVIFALLVILALSLLRILYVSKKKGLENHKTKIQKSAKKSFKHKKANSKK